jgi:hypothetical protein
VKFHRHRLQSQRPSASAVPSFVPSSIASRAKSDMLSSSCKVNGQLLQQFHHLSHQRLQADPNHRYRLIISTAKCSSSIIRPIIDCKHNPKRHSVFHMNDPAMSADGNIPSQEHQTRVNFSLFYSRTEIWWT